MAAKMQRYRVTGAVRFNAGDVLALNREQAAARAHVLEPGTKGTFNVTGRVQFKAGEEIGVPGKLPRYLEDRLEPLGNRRKAADPPPVEVRPDVLAAIAAITAETEGEAAPALDDVNARLAAGGADAVDQPGLDAALATLKADDGGE